MLDKKRIIYILSVLVVGITIVDLYLLFLAFYKKPYPAQRKLQALAVENPIFSENQQTGSINWQVKRKGFYVSNDTAQQIKGYASAVSVNKGENITFYVTVNPVQSFSMDVYRMGWYQGTGGRLMQHIDVANGVSQPSCPIDGTTGLRECNWSPSYTLAVPTDWTSGAYLVLLTNSEKYQDYIVFTVRDDTRAADFLFQQSVTTYQAYNNYPDDGSSGKSLYDNTSKGPNTIAGSPRAVKVSFDRPYSSKLDNGAGHLFAWEIHLIRFLEREGYNVAYTTNVDTHANGARLLNYKAFFSTGHDEYYSKEMYDALANARDNEVSLAFFGSNQVYWQIRFEPSSQGVPLRTIVGYKSASIDPIADPSLKTTRWRSSPVNRPEQELVGTQYTSKPGAGKNYVATSSGHWVYTNTGVKDGDIIKGIVGYETNRMVSSAPLPSGTNYTILANSLLPSGNDYHNASFYEAISGARVFSSGTMSWSWGLDSYKSAAVDARIQQITKNILDNFINASTPAPILPPAPQPSVYKDAVMLDNPLAYWRLGEQAGIIAYDEKNSYNGYYTTNPRLGQSGALANDLNTSVEFDGANSFFTLPSLTPSLNTPTFSFEAWAYPTTNNKKNRTVVSNRYGSNGWILYLLSSNKWSLWINSGTGLVKLTGPTATLSAWTHLVGTFDGTTAKLYVNGVLVNQTSIALHNPNYAKPLTIGNYNLADFFLGRVDEVSLYGSSLTAQQVQSHYNAGL